MAITTTLYRPVGPKELKLIKALNNHWKPLNWRDEYLNDERLKSPCLVWWEELGKIWGIDTRNQLIADVNETDSGEEYILLATEQKISLRIARFKGFNLVLQYAIEQKEIANKKPFNRIEIS